MLFEHDPPLSCVLEFSLLRPAGAQLLALVTRDEIGRVRGSDRATEPAANADLGVVIFQIGFKNAAKGSRAVGVRSAAPLPFDGAVLRLRGRSVRGREFLRGEVACGNITIIAHMR